MNHNHSSRPDIVRQFASLAEIATLVNADTDPGSMLDRIVFAVCRYTQWDMSSIMSIDEEHGRTVLMARYDPQGIEVAAEHRTWNLQTSPALQVLRTGKPVALLDAKNDPTYPFYRDDARERDYCSVVLVPLPARDVHGRPMVMTVQSKVPANVDRAASEFLLTVSHLAAIAVEKARRLADEQALSERMRQTVEVAGTLMRLVLSDASPERVLEVVERLLGYPVCVTDLSAAVVLTSEQTRGLASHADVLARIEQHLNLALQTPASVTLHTPPVTDREPFLSGRVYALEVDGSCVGDFYLLGEHGEIDAIDKLLLQQVQFALGVLLMRSVVRFKSLAESQSQILEDLTCGQWRTEEDIRALAAAAGIRLGRAARLVAVSLPLACRSRAELLARNHRAASFLVGQVFDGAVVTMIRATEWLLWLPVSASMSEHADDDSRLKTLCAEIERLVGQPAMLCVSERCEKIQDYTLAWQTCLRAMQLALRFSRTGVLHERDFGANALILAAMPADAVRDFQHDMLKRLAAFDARNNSGLIDTVDAFLRSNCRLQRCADAMSIHVTTLRHRLERLREMFGVDFEDAEQRFNLQLALRIRALETDGDAHSHAQAVIDRPS